MGVTTKLRHVKSYPARDQDGNQFLVEVRRMYLRTETGGGSTVVASHVLDFRTTDGLELSWIERGKYVAVATGEVLTSDDAEAE